MAQRDLQAFLQQRLAAYDPTYDLTSGSPIDAQVIQPILRRLGTDPFTVDIGLFIQTLLNQQFPDMPTKEGDAITDLLIKAAIVLWNPLVREITRVSNNLSFRDPTILTTDEADALGANLFATRITGEFTTGLVRVYFAQPQNIAVTPVNFITSREGLHFFPTESQSIRIEEMLLNLEDSLYYFDINVIAEAAGDQYNIDADDVVTIANMASAARITNKVRFRAGVPDESAVDFINRAEQSLTERSLVTTRGISAKITADFPEVTRLGVIGFNDPEMQRDVLTGGGLGPILAAGVAMVAEADGESALNTRRVSTAELGVDFTALVGPIGTVTGQYVLTLANAYPAAMLPLVRDLTVRTVIDPTTLDVNEQVINYAATGVVWTLRQQSLTLSGIPGGILFPDTPDGTVVVPDNQIHIGGATDVFVRGASFDPDTLVLTDIVDDEPLLSGVSLEFISATEVQLVDFILGTNYSVFDATWTAIHNAVLNNLSIQILDPPNAGSYRILDRLQVIGASPILTISPALTVVSGDYRWRISSAITIDLVNPRETRIAGSDLRTVQGVNTVDVLSGVDFADYGVSPGDTLRITTGLLIQGDYTVQQVVSPFFTKVQVDRPLPATVNGAKYSIFRPNVTGGVVLPLVRIDSIDLLDTSGQPVGTQIPYANPVDIRTRGFANPTHGVKADITDATLGIVSLQFTSEPAVGSLSLHIKWDGQSPFTVTFTGPPGGHLSIAAIVSQINAVVSTVTSGVITRLAVLLPDNDYFGILPVGSNVTLTTASTALSVLFPYDDRAITSRDINSAEVHANRGWAALRPALDFYYDIAQVLDGLQVGFYGSLTVPNTPFNNANYDPLVSQHDFLPEVRRHIQVGARSLGTARCYFLAPTSFEVATRTALTTVFTLTASDGSKLNFFPDPTNNYQAIPPLSGGAKPLDGETGGAVPADTLQSLTTDFIQKGIQPGDLLVLDYAPLVGSIGLADPVVTAATKTLIVSINGGSDKTIIFIRDSGAIPATDVSRQGIVDQINKLAGQVIASLGAFNHLRFNPDASVVIRAAGSANALLGFSTILDSSNDGPNKGTYSISSVGPGGNPNQVTVDPSVDFPTGSTHTLNQQFKVLRQGTQRIVSTAMAVQTEDPSLYYFDVELVSEGTGDQYNVAADLGMTVVNFRSDGYYLTTDDANLTFSPVERPKMHLSSSILEVGVSDDPANATQLGGQNIQLNYERSTLTNNVDNYIRSETERVVNESPLGRHLIPYFVRFVLTYSGGSAENIVTPDIETFIQNLYPTDSLDSSDLVKLALNRGARAVDSPINLIAVIHNFDRTITVERSQDFLNLGTLAAFIPDVLTITRKIT